MFDGQPHAQKVTSVICLTLKPQTKATEEREQFALLGTGNIGITGDDPERRRLPMTQYLITN